MWELTWPEVQEAVEGGFGIMIPVGAVEQHGYHLPLATDFLIPTELCLAIAEKLICWWHRQWLTEPIPDRRAGADRASSVRHRLEESPSSTR